MRKTLARRSIQASTSSYEVLSVAAAPHIPALSPLDQCLNLVRFARVFNGLAADDVFKLCGLLSGGDDPLRLGQDTAFRSGVAQYYKQLDDETIPSFQKSFIEKALAGSLAQTSGSGVLSASAVRSPTSVLGHPSPGKHHPHAVASAGARPAASISSVATQAAQAVDGASGDPSVEERIAAVWEIVTQSRDDRFLGSSDVNSINAHCDALKPVMRRVNARLAASLVKALAVINYQNYAFTALLARRCCEVASQWDVSDACQVLFNLVKLNIQDSLVAIVNRIDANTDAMQAKSVFLFLQAMERQPNTSAVAAKVVPKVAARAVDVAPNAESIAFHRAFLVCMSRYGLGKHPSVLAMVADAARFFHTDRDAAQTMKVSPAAARDIFPLLQALVDLRIPVGAKGVSELLSALQDIIPSTEVHNLGHALEFLSVYPCDSGAMMGLMLQRLEHDCAKLSMVQFVSVLELLSSYPPAKHHACMARFAFAANTMRDTLDADAIERTIAYLVQAEQLSDDLFALCDFAHKSRQGVARSFDGLMQLLEATSDAAAKDPRWRRVLVHSVESLAALLNDEDVSAVRKEVERLGIQDPNLQQKIFGRMRQLQRDAGAKRQRQYKRGYDPVDDL